MEWRDVTGYKWPYRVSDTGRVQKLLENGEWYELKPYTAGRRRVCVKMRTAENKKVDVPVTWLVADAFMGGKKTGMCIVHRNGAKFDCAVDNLKFVTRSECGKMAKANRRKTVVKIDIHGNVVEFYSSGRVAAKKNHMSQSAMCNRCNKKVQDPFALDGYDYRYDR